MPIWDECHFWPCAGQVPTATKGPMLTTQRYLTEAQWRALRMDTKAIASELIERRDALQRLHCDDGPAVIYPSGKTVYYHHGLLHRADGPAIVSPYADPRYYVYGEQISPEEINRLGLDGAVMKRMIRGKK